MSNYSSTPSHESSLPGLHGLSSPSQILSSGQGTPIKLKPLESKTISPSLYKEEDFQTPDQSPKTAICTPCKRIRLESIPILELPPPFLFLDDNYFFSSDYK